MAYAMSLGNSSSGVPSVDYALLKQQEEKGLGSMANGK